MGWSGLAAFVTTTYDLVLMIRKRTVRRSSRRSYQANLHFLRLIDAIAVSKYPTVRRAHNQLATSSLAHVNLIPYQTSIRGNLSSELYLTNTRGAALSW